MDGYQAWASPRRRRGPSAATQQLLELQIHRVGPAEANHILRIARGDLHLGATGRHVIFLADRAVIGQTAIDGAVNSAAMRRASASYPHASNPDTANQFVGAQPNGESHCAYESVILRGLEID